MTLTLMIYIASISYFRLLSSNNSTRLTIFLVLFFVPVLILSLAFNIIFLLLDERCCGSRSQNCFCSSCCGSNCFEHEVYCINAKSDSLDIVKIENRYD